RRLKCGGPDVTCLMDAPARIFGDELGMAPRMLSENGWERVILTRSYARKPGRGVARLEQKLQNKVPEDFRAFHEVYDEALVTTRTYPLHLWNVDRILSEVETWRDIDNFPLRLFRFAQYWDIYGLYFALWQENPKGDDWKVVIVSHGHRDDQLDEYVEPECIVGESFYAWLKSWIERDGLPDPFKEIGIEGGFLDPA
ncbi:MAG TPA: SMI1/KNR4 family protein, partial [Verrucomicrobium sp.]|nr:SMI1/KNR4 family protein [Verrucomicrobium sp.]